MTFSCNLDIKCILRASMDMRSFFLFNSLFHLKFMCVSAMCKEILNLPLWLRMQNKLCEYFNRKVTKVLHLRNCIMEFKEELQQIQRFMMHFLLLLRYFRSFTCSFILFLNETSINNLGNHSEKGSTLNYTSSVMTFFYIGL